MPTRYTVHVHRERGPHTHTPRLEQPMNLISSSAVTNALVPVRTLVHDGSTAGNLDTRSLEGMRDYLKRMHAAQAPWDPSRSLSQLALNFRGDQITARFVDGTEDFVVSSHAYGQICSSLLGKKGHGQLLLDTAKLDDTGGKIANALWMHRALGSDAGQVVRTLRFVNTRTPNGVKRMLRSQHSEGYAVYDNHQAVDALLANAPELAGASVLDFRVTDVGFRARIAGVPEDQIELNVPIPMFQLWNSEVGMRRTGLTGGMWKLWCTNGCGTWSDRAEFHWRHYGNSQRIEDGMSGAVRELRVANSGVLSEYRRALDTVVDDLEDLITRELRREKVSQPRIDAAIKLLEHETVDPTELWTDRSSDRPRELVRGSVASAVDAVTLAAQDFGLFEQAEMERGASRMMHRNI